MKRAGGGFRNVGLGGEEENTRSNKKTGECNNQPGGQVTIYPSSEGVERNVKILGGEEERREEGEEGRPVCHNIVTNEIVK